MTQKNLRILYITAVFVFSFFGLNFKGLTAISSAPSLVITQVKVTTNSQFITLYNNTAQSIDMGKVWLQYFNNYLLSNTTSTKNIQLNGTLPSHGYYIINDGPLTLCYQAVIQSSALGFSTKAGMVQVMRLSQQLNGIVSSTTEDFVRWSSGTVGGVQTMPADPAFLQRQMVNGIPVENSSWQTVKPKSANSCDLVTSIAPNNSVTPANQLLPAIPPSATIISVASQSNSKLPASDIGLHAPQLNEILPNPASPQTDSKNEFIEIYNSNPASFDLSGFKLQQASSPTSTKHTFTFPIGTVIPAKSFAAYPSSNISINLTNSGGIVWLLDPNDKVISQIEPYSTAKDGQAWALANGKWYWTSRPTPGAANVVEATSNKTSGTGTGVGTVLGASSGESQAPGSNNFSNTAKPRSINSSILVGVAALALIYGLYEYRRDLANAVHKFKRNRAVGRENRPKP